MAIGLNPSYTTSIALERYTPQQFLVLALDAAANLGWYLHYVSDTGLVATSVQYRSEVTLRIESNSASITSISLDNLMIDFGRNKKNVRRFLQTLSDAKGQATEEYLYQRYEQIWPYLPAPEADALLQRKPRLRSQRADILSIFRLAPGYLATPLLLNINLLVFFFMAISGVGILEPASRDLIQWGANLRGLSFGDGQWWRIITSFFLHIGIVHLLMNMYALLLIGAQLEGRLGTGRFLLAYMLSGIGASLTSLVLHDFGISAGASGAIFGMYGVFLALLTGGVVEKRNRKQLLASILFFVVYNLLGGLQPGIDNAAHIGGLITGLALGYLFLPAVRKNNPEAKNQITSLPPAAEGSSPATPAEQYY